MLGIRVPVQAAFFSGFGESDVHPLEAFDNALKDSGVHEFNLVYYSSILPAKVKFVSVEALKGLPRGAELPVVLSAVEGVRGEVLAACIGYAYNEKFGGIVVETHAKGSSEEELVLVDRTVSFKELKEFTRELAERLLENRGVFSYDSGTICAIGKVKKAYGYAVAGVAFLAFAPLRGFFLWP